MTWHDTCWRCGTPGGRHVTHACIGTNAAAVSATSTEPGPLPLAGDAPGSVGAAVSPTPEEAAARDIATDVLTNRREADVCDRECYYPTTVMLAEAVLALVAALRDARRAHEDAERYAIHDPAVDWPSDRKDSSIDAILAAFDDEREAHEGTRRERDQARDALAWIVSEHGSVDEGVLAVARAALGGAAEDGAT